MSSCDLCNLSKKCKNPGIRGDSFGATRKSRIMIVQDYPTFKDDRSDEVPTTDTLQKILYFFRKAGINKKDVYFTSGIKCSVPKAGDIKKKHVDICRNLILEEIKEVKPEIIIAMGKTAHWIITDNQTVSEYAGHFSDFEMDYEVENNITGEVRTASFACKVMPTFGLQASLGKWEYNTEIIRHLKKAMAYLETKVVPVTPDPKINVILSLEALEEFKQRMLKVDWAATDLETTGFEFFKDRIINSGYCSDGENVDIIYLEEYKKEHIESFDKENQLRAIQINRFIRAHKPTVLAAMKEIHEHVNVILHNGKFDSKFTAYNGVPYKKFYADSLIGDSLVDENLAHGLNFCFERNGINFGPYDTALWPYTNKDEKKRKSYQWVPPYLIEKYLGYDVYGLALLWPKMEKQLEAAKLTKHFFLRKMPALKMVTNSEYVGMKADKKLILTVSKAINKKQDETLAKVKKFTEDRGYKPKKGDFNPNSGVQISEFMVAQEYPLEKLDIPQNSTGFSSAAEHLEKLIAIKKYSEFPKMVMDFKKLSKIKGTYVDGKDGEGGMIQYLDPYHRIHTNFNLWTPRTSRWSANRPSVQVWPRPLTGLPNARNFIVPTNGWNLFEADYRALEMYVIAALSKDRVLINLLKSGKDVHSYNATSLGKVLNLVDKSVTYEKFLDYIGKGVISKDDIEKDTELKRLYLEYTELRTQSKNIGFGLSYGKGAVSFAEEFGITEEEAQDMIDAYFEVYPEMKKWRDDIVRRALLYGEIKLPSGRPRRFHAAIDWLNAEESKSTWGARRLKEEIARQAMNTPVQGGAHEVFEPACIRLTRRLKAEGLKARLGFYIHDGILGECPPEENEMVAKCVQEEMPFTFHKGTDLELNLGVDLDFYKTCWYGEKFHVGA